MDKFWDLCLCCRRNKAARKGNWVLIHYICAECSCKLPIELIEVVLGNREAFSETRMFHICGTWTKDNWEQYPTVIKIRNSFAPQEAKEDHTGQTYNPFTDSWLSHSYTSDWNTLLFRRKGLCSLCDSTY
jgi:hypothetical protein